MKDINYFALFATLILCALGTFAFSAMAFLMVTRVLVDTVKLSKPASVELEVPSETEGEVHGPGGTDKVPAMLTAGEFVMSRGAVQKYGVKTLEGMNSAGGGTNQPKVIKDKVYAKEGGYIGDREKTPDCLC